MHPTCVRKSPGKEDGYDLKPFEATRRVRHPPGKGGARQPEASLAWAAVTALVKRRQQALKPCGSLEIMEAPKPSRTLNHPAARENDEPLGGVRAFDDLDLDPREKDGGRLFEDGPLEPNNSEIYVNLGHAHKDAKNVGLAIDAYKYALTLEPDNFDIYVNLGHALKGAGDVASAHEDLVATRHGRQSF